MRSVPSGATAALCCCTLLLHTLLDLRVGSVAVPRMLYDASVAGRGLMAATLLLETVADLGSLEACFKAQSPRRILFAVTIVPPK
jgi:hypothetical protein